MSTFLWSMLFLFGLAVIGQLCMLGSGEYPPRTSVSVALDCAINTGVLVWIAILLRGA